MTGFATAAAVLAAVIWLYLVLFRRRFWRSDQMLPPAAGDAGIAPAVAAVVPARDEAQTIGDTIAALAAQDYPGPLSIVVVDDGSTDGTGRIARTAGRSAGRPVHVIDGAPLERGWTGKLWALCQGVDAADGLSPPPEYVWLTDADVVHGPATLRRLVAKAEGDGRDMVSLMVRLNVRGLWERLLIPAFIFFFQKLYPFAAVNDPAARAAAAAGGCILARRQALRMAGGIAAIRGRLIDDCALAAAVQAAGGRIWLGLADDSHSLRKYDRLRDIWDMVARTAFAQLGHSPVLLLGTVAAMGLVYLVPPLATVGLAAHGPAAGAFAGALAWGLMALAYAPTLAYHGVSRWFGFIGLPVAAVLFTAMTVDSAWRHWRGRGGGWKGRHYGTDHDRPAA